MKQPNPGPGAAEVPDRPLAVTLICLWWFVAVPIGALLAIAEIARVWSAPGASEALRMSYTGLALYTIVLGFGVVSMFGVWRMRKWGVIALAVLFVLGQLIGLIGGGWSLGGLVAWLIALIVGAIYYTRMR